MYPTACSYDINLNLDERQYHKYYNAESSYMDLGKRLKYFREIKKLSIYRLSQGTNVSQGYMENVKSNLPLIL